MKSGGKAAGRASDREDEWFCGSLHYLNSIREAREARMRIAAAVPAGSLTTLSIKCAP